MVQELVNGKETATDTDVNAVHVNTDDDTLGSELVNTLGLTHEHDLELLAVGVVVDVLSKTLVYRIVLHRDVDSDARLEINDVLLEGLNLMDQLLVLKLNLLQLL